MTKASFLVQRNIICTTLGALICLILLRSCNTRNSFPNIDLDSFTLNPAVTGFTMKENAALDHLGYSVSATGDIDKDGYDDIIIGAYAKDNSQGAVYVIYGGEESTMSDLDFSSAVILNPLTTGFMMKGNAPGDKFGWSVSTAGDIDKDGYDDIIIGAPGKNGGRGAAYVVYGGPRSSMSNRDFGSGATLNPTSTGFMITESAAAAACGYSVNTAGDIDKDGYDDIIIGANAWNTGDGAAYVIYGGERSSMTDIVLGSPALNPASTGFMIRGEDFVGYLGNSVSVAGDINNDGYDDIIVAASRQNIAYVIYGGARSSMKSIDLNSITLYPASTGFTIRGSSVGYSVSTAGDVDNDGFDDIIIGAALQDASKGAVYVIYGREKSPFPNVNLFTTTLDPLTTGFMITGTRNGAVFGYSVSTAGDLNNDGHDDIIVGAPYHLENKGVVYVIYGGARSSMTNIALSSTTLIPTSTGFMITGETSSWLGHSVSTGDINKDGYNDIILGAPSKDTARATVYVIYGSCPPTCKQCSSESVCTECQSPYLLYQSECFATCPEGTQPTSPNTCESQESCPAHCDKCSSSSVCTECENSYFMYQSECFASCPDMTFANTATNTCEDCPENCNHCTSPSVCTECMSPFVLSESQCLASCPKAMFNSNNVCKDCSSHCSSCTSQDSCQACYPVFTLSNSLCVVPVPSSSSSDQEVQENAIQRISAAAKLISSAVCVGRTVAPFAMLASKTVQNTRYLDLSVTDDLSDVYQTWEKDMVSWEVPNFFSSRDNFESSPPLFARYGTGSPFLVNFWPTLANIAGGLAIFITCFVLQRLLKKSNFERWNFLMQTLVATSFNFTLIQAYAYLDDILFYLVLDMKTNPLNSFFSCASLISAVVFLAFGCLLVLFNFWIARKYQKTKKQEAKNMEAFNEKNKRWKLFYSDFNDDNLLAQSFLAIQVMRSTLSSLIITVFYDYPLMQTLSLVIMDVLIILFLYVKNPFKTLRGKLAQYFYEAIILLVHLSTFSLSLKPSDTIKTIFSTVIIYLNTVLIIGAVGFMIYEIYKTISEIKRAAKLKERQVVPQQNQEVQNLTQTKSPFHALETETGGLKRPDWANMDQTASPGNFYLLPGATPTGDVNLSPEMKSPSRAPKRRPYKINSIVPINN